MSSKIIVLLADGTGNSATKLFKTNVWRLYKALDLAENPENGATRQVAYYHDGVGTSTFKPLAILGGVCGVGLKRNVLEIYRFLCRNYNPGDRIYAYGFSRGAFTVRVLAGLVLTQGVLRCRTEEELNRYAVDAYRRYRFRYKLPLLRRRRANEDPGDTVGLVDRLRNLRNRVISAWRRFRGSPQYHEILQLPGVHIPNVPIDFLGVWDTVAAYGLPIDEMTRGIDKWVWPLSMQNFTLDPKVLRARHALSLDDERDTFHPLLWDELAEEKLVAEKQVLAGRLQQVWFAGVHSNVGGGYADDSLSFVALQWMMDESRKPVPRRGADGKEVTAPGLNFLPSEHWEHRGPLDPFGTLYNSRRGAATYYRYQPRKISARLEDPDPTTLMMQDPNRKVGFLKRVQVHESVLDRIRDGNDRYAPIVLPPRYEVVGSDGTVTPRWDREREDRQEWVWNDVWRRRVNYFMTLVVSAVLVLFPVIQIWFPPAACSGPQCLLTPVIQTAGAVLPGLVQPWIAAFAISPGWFLLVALIIVFLMLRGSYLKRSIQDGMRELWAQTLQLPLGAGRPATAAGKSPEGLPSGGWDGAIWGVRASDRYQGFFQWLKWRALPGAFGTIVLFGGILLIGVLILVGVQRGRIAYADWSGRNCQIGTTTEALGGEAGVFDTSAVCWATRVRVKKGSRYVITMRVTDDWVDNSIPASPAGFESSRFVWYVRPAILLRRSLSGDWFEPIVRVVPRRGRGGHAQVLDMRVAVPPVRVPPRPGDPPNVEVKAVYTGEFEAGVNGEVFLYVNDMAANLFTGPTDRYYANNRGKAQVRIEPFRVDERRATSGETGGAVGAGDTRR